MSRIALLWNPDDAGSRLAAKAQLASGPQQGLTVQSIPIKVREDLDAALAALAANPPEGLLVHSTPILFVHREVIAAFALQQHLPSFSASTAMARDGLLAGYGPDIVTVWRRAARPERQRQLWFHSRPPSTISKNRCSQDQGT